MYDNAKMMKKSKCSDAKNSLGQIVPYGFYATGWRGSARNSVLRICPEQGLDKDGYSPLSHVWVPQRDAGFVEKCQTIVQSG
jgi:hypothetical protein